MGLIVGLGHGKPDIRIDPLQKWVLEGFFPYKNIIYIVSSQQYQGVDPNPGFKYSHLYISRPV
jgi:hypothetical protein